jgi:hypothetical protein
MAATAEDVQAGVDSGEAAGTASVDAGGFPADPPEQKTGGEPGAGVEAPAAAEAAPPTEPAKPAAPAAPSLDDLRSTVTDSDRRAVLDRFNSLDDMAKALLDFRKRESDVRVPGRDATEEQLAAYHKAIGVPEEPSGYEFVLPEGHEATEDDTAFQEHFGKVFHEAALSVDQAKALNEAWNAFSATTEEAVRKADEAFVKDAEQALRTKWGGDYEQNQTLAKRGAEHLFGAGLDDALGLEMKSGRLLLDHPAMLEAFSKVGAELRESGEGPRMGDSERATLTEEIDDLGRRKMEAMDSGDRALAARLDAEQLAAIERRDGSGPIVGADTRTA